MERPHDTSEHQPFDKMNAEPRVSSFAKDPESGGVHIGMEDGIVTLSHGKDGSPALRYTMEEWVAFLRGVNNNEFGEEAGFGVVIEPDS